MVQSTIARDRQSKMKKVQEQFENWRKNRKTISCRIPENLWEAAVGLYGEYKISEISKVLRLGGGQLKKRISNAQEKKVTSTRTFIQMEIPKPQSTQGEWLIEVENSDGAKMKISGSGLQIPDIALICQSFVGKK